MKVNDGEGVFANSGVSYGKDSKTKMKVKKGKSASKKIKAKRAKHTTQEIDKQNEEGS